MQNVTFRNQRSQTSHTIIHAIPVRNRTQSRIDILGKEEAIPLPRRKEVAKNLKVEIQTFLRMHSVISRHNSLPDPRERKKRKEGGSCVCSEGLFARELVVELELDLPTDSKPEDTFRADNRTRNASTMPRNAWREHREFAIVRGGTGTWPGVRVQKEAPRGPFAHCRSYAPDRPLSISFFPPFFSTRPSRSPKDPADRPGRLVSACPPPG